MMKYYGAHVNENFIFLFLFFSFFSFVSFSSFLFHCDLVRAEHVTIAKKLPAPSKAASLVGPNAARASGRRPGSGAAHSLVGRVSPVGLQCPRVRGPEQGDPISIAAQ